jgi:thioredoxin 1
MLKYLENESFNEIINQDKILVDFYAEWCGPCKMLTPVLERLGDSFEIVKVDVDKHFDLAKEYGIMSVPTLIIFKNGKIVKQMIGFMGYDELKDELERA